MATTSFRLPTVARSLNYDGGSGEWSNVNNALLADGSYATCDLPDGSTYTPTSTETDAGQVLSSGILLNGYNFSSELPANAVVTGITVQTILFSTYAGADQDIFYKFQFCGFPDAVPFNNAEYWLFESQDTRANQGDTSVQTLGGSTDVWQPNPNLSIDGLFMSSTDGSFPGYEVQTSTLDPDSYDFFYNGHNLLIQPTTAGYSGSSMDAAGALTDYASILSNGGTVTVSFAGTGFTPTTFVAQSGPVTPGDATFQCAVSDNDTVASLSNQINAHADTGTYLYVSYFTDVVWEFSSTDVGSYTNSIRLTTNVPAQITFPNNGYLSNGADPDPNQSTMASSTAVPLINTSGGPILARQAALSGIFGLTITNTLSNFTLKHSVPASVFRTTDFGIVVNFAPADGGTGNPLLYPEIPDDQQKLDYVKIQLTYNLIGGGLLLLGVG